MTGPNKGEFMGRIGVLQRNLIKAEIDCAILLQNVDRYYYTGTFQDGALFVHTEHEPVLFIKRALSRAIEESPIDLIIGYRKLSSLGEFLHENHLSSRKIGIDMDVIPAKLYLDLQSVFPESELVDISESVRRQRAVKSSFEISMLREGGRRFDQVFDRIKGVIQPGMSEYQIYQYFTRVLLEMESSLYIRTRMFNMEAVQNFILSGENAAKLSLIDSPTAAGTGITVAFPYGAGMKILVKGEPIIIDSVFVFEGYIVDCTRVFTLGKLNRTFTRAHDVSRSCHDRFRKSAKPGVFIPDLYKNILELVDEKGLDKVFMGGVKFIGHGVGLELDELPVITQQYEDTLEEGMVIAFEPKFVFAGGTVGYENTYCIENGEMVSLNQTEESIQIL
jgi:Xaa-Pro aminopeptidase